MIFRLNKMDKHEIFEMTEKKIYLPVASNTVQGGFPSPAAEYEDKQLDINDIVIGNPNSTFYVRVAGNSMCDAFINEGDILVVDKELEAKHNDIVIAVVDGNFTVKTLHCKDGLVKLIPANPDFPEIVFCDGQELSIWGVVTYTIHKNRG